MAIIIILFNSLYVLSHFKNLKYNILYGDLYDSFICLNNICPKVPYIQLL